MKIWGRLSSINVRKVVLTAQLLGLPFERIDAGAAFGVVQDAQYKERNPNSLVPLLEDGDFTLWESNVIVRYLCAKHDAGGLYPLELHRRFDAERWMDWQQTTFNPAGRDAFLHLVRLPPQQRDPALCDRSITATEPLLDMLEVQLSKTPFLAGERLTMADLPLACELHRWWGLPRSSPERPQLRRWYDGIQALPAARGALDVPLS